ncbi:MAG: hypothetical protein G01um101493_75 [Microgenomates group bacterium Gr01-1014_93]|nr:MAG: hypothetical protein G01um101493_75 [Microgenomates group bacterium Gr01-1014_93]
MNKEGNDPWELTPEIIQEIEDHNRKIKEWDRQRVKGLTQLGVLLEATLVDIWGEMGPAGGTMYGVFRENNDELFHFIVIGKIEEVAIAEDLEEREAICIPLREALWRGEKPKVKFVLTRDEEPKEINGYIVTKFDPEKTPNDHPVETIEQFLGE